MLYFLSSAHLNSVSWLSDSDGEQAFLSKKYFTNGVYVKKNLYLH